MKKTIARIVQEGQIATGIGPMSKTCVDAIYRYSHEKKQPIMVIASRRQVECAALGHGYVNGWTTEEFGKHCSSLKGKFPQSEVFLCRDHGGPWQGTDEESMELEAAMERAEESFEADVLAGFDLLHIDPSLCKDGNVSTRAVLENTARLLRHCSEFAARHGKKIEFEIGTEENVGAITTPESFSQLVGGVAAVCARDGMEKPVFVVGQTNSLVKEMRQIGEFNAKNTAMLMAAAAKHGFLLKEHNADYLTEYQLRQRLKIGVPSMNVAPEFGVIESQAFIDFCFKNGQDGIVDRFLKLSLDSGKWRKWLINPDYVSDHDRSLIAGHYVFGKPEFGDMCASLDASALSEWISRAIESRLDFYFSRYH
jgi:tagatose-1,6-bisphosphate aldolase non-catalytic subunit AgaZ/GatZ